MRSAFFIASWFFSWISYAQALRDVNFNYLYNSTEKYRVTFHPIRQPGGWDVFFKFQLTDSVSAKSRYALKWEWRQALSSKEGILLDSLDQSTWKQHDQFTAGKISLSNRFTSGILAVQVVDSESKRSKWFYTKLEADYPVDHYLIDPQRDVEVNPYVRTSQSFEIGGSGQRLMVSYFNDNFPPGAPAFSETLAQVSEAIKADSLFTITSSEPVQFSKPGLYLVQKDTTESRGFAFRAEDDYPKYSKIESLYAPLIYITTKQEYDKLRLAKGDKKAFDRVILTITKDGERARSFMRSYFRRVDMTNQLFTSYKEGWKTDRGMIYVVFGPPDEVYRTDNHETWKYNNAQYKLTFNFVRSATLFDPENFVLLRDLKFQNTWYEVIDLWRNARF